MHVNMALFTSLKRSDVNNAKLMSLKYKKANINISRMFIVFCCKFYMHSVAQTKQIIHTNNSTLEMTCPFLKEGGGQL